MRILLLASLYFFPLLAITQNLYFPPINSDEWQTVEPQDLGWQVSRIPELYDFLDSEETKAFIVLKNGKIALEKYFGTFTSDSNWIWFSAAKAMTATLIGVAQQEGYLAIDDPSSDYLGEGWTSMSPEKERLITVRNQLTMTSGMDELFFTCTAPQCLIYKADAGDRWAYHNGPYSLLRDVLENATGFDYNVYTNAKLKRTTGMDGVWLKVGNNNLYTSTARSMARFGLLMLNKGFWGNEPVLSDAVYYESMINTSQSLNPSYGYLWWLNGKDRYIPPNPTELFQGAIAPDAPEDMFVGAGAKGQFVCVVPSQNLVLVRMGEEATDSRVPLELLNDIWKNFNPVIASTTSTQGLTAKRLSVYPNPAGDQLNIQFSTTDDFQVRIVDELGRLLHISQNQSQINLSNFQPGTYWVDLSTEEKIWRRKIVIHP